MNKTYNIVIINNNTSINEKYTTTLPIKVSIGSNLIGEINIIVAEN